MFGSPLLSGGVAFAAALFAVQRTFAARLPLILAPFQLNTVEGQVLYSGWLASHGRPLYNDPGQIPSLFSAYGPVPYYVVSFVFRVQGVGLAGPRLLVLAATLATAALIAIYVAKRSGSRLLGAILGMALLANLYVNSWFYLARVDQIGIAFSIAGLVLFSLLPERWYCAVPMFIAAWFSKVTLIAAPIACFVYLLYHRKYRTALYYAASGLAVGLAALWFVEHSMGGWYLFDMFRAHPDPYQPMRLLHYVGSATLHAWPFVALSVGYAINCIHRRRFSLSVTYFLICSLTVLTAGKSTADTNHLLEWVTATYLCAGAACAGLFRSGRFPVLRFGIAIALAATLAVEAATIHLHEARFESDLNLGTQCPQAYAYIRQHGSKILSDDTAAVVLAGKQPLVVDFAEYFLQVRYRGVSEEPFDELLQRRGADLIALPETIEHMKAFRNRPWTPQAVDLVGRYYAPAAVFDCGNIAIIYEPKRSKSERQSN